MRVVLGLLAGGALSWLLGKLDPLRPTHCHTQRATIDTSPKDPA